MRRLTLRNTAQEVAAICLGAAYLGSREDERTARDILDYYVSRGGNFINTAHEYGFGASEKTIGRWMKERGNRRELVITTKGGEDHARPNNRAMRYHELIEDAEESLTRLDTDYLDFFLLHVDDETVPVDEIVDALAVLKQQGKILNGGCSNWSPPRIEQAFAYAAKTGKPVFSIDEIEWNLAVKNYRSGEGGVMWMDGEYLAYHQKRHLNVGAYSPLAVGVFQKMAAGRIDSLPPWQQRAYVNEINLRRAARLKQLSEASGEGIAALLLGFLCARQEDFSTVPIVGARSVSQLAESLDGASCVVTSEMIRFIAGE